MCLHIPAKGICMIAVAILVHATVDDISNNEWYSMIAMVLTMISVWIAMRILRIDVLIKKLYMK
jgi:hypothetical protein